MLAARHLKEACECEGDDRSLKKTPGNLGVAIRHLEVAAASAMGGRGEGLTEDGNRGAFSVGIIHWHGRRDQFPSHPNRIRLHSQPMPTSSLAPALLLAAPPLGDPNFAKSVVLLGVHSKDGAIGWVLNGEAVGPTANVLQSTGLVPTGTVLPCTTSYRSQVRTGGPVNPKMGWLLYRRAPQWDHPAQIAFTDEWAGSAERSLIVAVARGEGPSVFRLILGYAGWGPSQLDDEIRVGSWLPVPFDSEIALSPDLGEMWERAYAQLVGVSPLAFMASRRGSA